MFEKAGQRLFGSRNNDQYQPPPGHPPPHESASSYGAPPGPPPTYASGSQTQAAPEKSQTSDEAPPPYHDWQNAVPDTSELPPPPGMNHDYSTGANATKDEADQAQQWCYFHALWPARPLSAEQLNAVRAQNHTIVWPTAFNGDFRQDNTGAWLCHTRTSTKDTLIQTALPIYSAPADSPLVTERFKTIYFEVKIISFGEQASRAKSSLFSRHKHQDAEEFDAGLAIGFFAPPYPPFRLPGWQRGSLGVHSDDGRRYVNDTDGGIDFTSPFKGGQTVGLGITYKIPNRPPAYGGQFKLDIEVFFTRDGKKEGSWDLNEERDATAEAHGIEGLEGEHDLFPAAGVFGAVEWEFRFREQEWLYRPGR